MGKGFDFGSIEMKGLVVGKRVCVMFGGRRNIGSHFVAVFDNSGVLASSVLLV